MAIQKIKFTSDSVKETEIKLNQNFSEIELAFDGKQDVMQYDAMPTASATYAGKIAQYVGATAGDYTNGYFYKCVLDGSNYVWQQVSVQPASTVTLNGTPTSAAAFYAPLNGGTEGKVLKAHGNGQAPTWEDSVDVDTGATSIETVGAGNAVTTASYDAATRKITLTKGETFQTETDNRLNTSSQTVVGAINEVNTVAKNANIAKGFTSYSALITELNSASSTAYKVGQSLYVQTQEVPDLWIIGVESSSSAYTYTTDAAFITATGAVGGQQVGYYKLAQLETQKVDLTNYVQKTTTIAGIDLQDDITAAELKTALDIDDKQDKIIQYAFTVGDSGWSAIDSDGFYTLTIPSTKIPDNVYKLDNGLYKKVMAELDYDDYNIYVATDTKFAGVVTAH